LISLGVPPLEFADGTSRRDLQLDGTELLDIVGLDGRLSPGTRVQLVIHYADGSERRVPLVLKIDTASALESVRHGGVMQQTLREHAATLA